MSALCIGNNDACISLCHALSLQMIQGVSILFPPATCKFSYAASDSLKGILKCLLSHPNIQYLSDVWFKATDWVPKVRTDWRPQKKKKIFWLRARGLGRLWPSPMWGSQPGLCWPLMPQLSSCLAPPMGSFLRLRDTHLAACPLACFQTHIHI